MNIYPALKFHNIYLLSGGYSEFVSKHPGNCSDNGGYTKMTDKKFVQELSDMFDERKNMRSVGFSKSSKDNSISTSSSDIHLSPQPKAKTAKSWNIFNNLLSGGE
jgi:hypothetical protein